MLSECSTNWPTFFFFIRFNPSCPSLKWVPLLSPFHRWGNWETVEITALGQRWWVKELKSKGNSQALQSGLSTLALTSFPKPARARRVGWVGKGKLKWPKEQNLRQRSPGLQYMLCIRKRKKNKTKPKHRMRQTKQGIRMHSETAKCRVNIRDSGSPLLRLCDRAATLLPLPSYRHKPCLRWEVSNAKCVGWS